MNTGAQKMVKSTPTQIAYSELQTAFDHFNEDVFYKTFKKRLPQCLITFQRKNGVLGYYHSNKFTETDGGRCVDEIAMNPSSFDRRTIEKILSTLVHEMAHQYQKHYGKPGRGKYHNAEWADIMETAGLMPSNTGAAGGKRTGDKMTHYIIEGGVFANSCAVLLTKDFRISFADACGWETTAKVRTKNKSNRIKYTCHACATNAWGKPDLKILCGNDDCDAALMEATE